MKFLSEAAVRHYRDLGYYAPVPVLTRAEAGVLRHRLEASRRQAAECRARCVTSRICSSPG